MSPLCDPGIFSPFYFNHGEAKRDYPGKEIDELCMSPLPLQNVLSHCKERHSKDKDIESLLSPTDTCLQNSQHSCVASWHREKLTGLNV